jgi:hypothetical protein
MKNKQFDSVEFMRKRRDELSRKFYNMTFEQQKEYIRRNL